MRYETSANAAGDPTSLEQYIERKKEDQKDIYYLISSNRVWAEESPYYETFKKKGIEVLFLTEPIDEFVVENLREFKGMKLKSVDASGNEDVLKNDKAEDDKTDDAASKLSAEEKTKLSTWVKETLGKSVSDVKVYIKC